MLQPAGRVKMRLNRDHQQEEGERHVWAGVAETQARLRVVRRRGRVAEVHGQKDRLTFKLTVSPQLTFS